MDPVPANPATGPPRCGLCGEAIGMYEPYALEGDDPGERKSRLVRPIPAGAEPAYHLDCYVSMPDTLR